MLSIESFTVLLPTCIFYAHGPCALISTEFCNLCNALFSNSVIQSTKIQCISFWYRLRMLSQDAPTPHALHSIVLACSLPNIVHMVIFKSATDFGAELLRTAQTIYPHRNWTGVPMYGFSNIFEPIKAATYGYFFVMMTALFVSIFFTDSTHGSHFKILRKLGDKKWMSDKTYAMHRVFLKILTIHALLPIMNVAGCACVFLIILGVYIPELEALIFVSAVTPACVNPAVTLWFLKPYRTYLRNLLCCKSTDPNNQISVQREVSSMNS